MCVYSILLQGQLLILFFSLDPTRVSGLEQPSAECSIIIVNIQNDTMTMYHYSILKR